jgi:outer membrane protein assembly factor BamB
MRRTKTKTLFIVLLCLTSIAQARVISQWRGPQRDGLYRAKGLLKQWPDSGPRMLWSFEGLGKGHGSVALAHDKVYVTGMHEGAGFLYAFSDSGDLVWKRPYGPEWTKNYPGTRTTVTVVDNLLYLESGMGAVHCLYADSGDPLWSVNLLVTFQAKNIKWGMAESVLIDGDHLICTPGGPVFNVVALNRFTGKTVWTSPGHGGQAAYCSPILVHHNGTKLIVTMTAESVIGVDAQTGECYWRVPQHQTHKIHANTPVYIDGKILCASSSAKNKPCGLVLIDLSEDGKQATERWRNQGFTNLMAAIVVRDGHIYGSKHRKGEWYCLDLETGATKTVFKGLGDGVITYADGLFYCYSEKGQMALVDATPSAFKIISSFTVPLGSDQHWAHPVIRDGRLYLRHGDALMAYDIDGGNRGD